MSSRYSGEEKKVEDLTYLDDADDSPVAKYRVERLERQLEQLSAELIYIKQQQAKGQQQVRELQTDLIAAELARQAAEEQLAHQQRHDHEMMHSLFRKFMDNQRSSDESFPAVIDVTKYSDSESEVHQYIDENDPNKLSQIAKELQELSLAVQQHSSDQLQQREALELAWMNYKTEQSKRLQQVEDDSAALYKGLKDMALTWDQKLHEMNAQIQKVRKTVASQNISSISSVTSPLVTETAEKVESLSAEMTQVQQSMQRYLDTNRRINGERIVTKRKTEQDLRTIRHAVKRLTTVVFELAEKVDAPVATNGTATTIEEGQLSIAEKEEECVDAPARCEEEPLIEELDPVGEPLEDEPDLKQIDDGACAVHGTLASCDQDIVTESATLESNYVSHEEEPAADEKPCFLGEVHAFLDIESESLVFVEESNGPVPQETDPENEVTESSKTEVEEDNLNPENGNNNEASHDEEEEEEKEHI